MKLPGTYAIRATILTGLLIMPAYSASTLVDLSVHSDPLLDIDEGTINGALFRIDSTHPAGTGIFGRDAGGVFSTIQNSGVEEGYNTSYDVDKIMDNKKVPQWNHEITVGSLHVITLNNVEYVPFLLDINESANNDKNLLSLDDLKIFATSLTAVSETTVGGLIGLLGNPLYSMDGPGGDDNTVLLDYNRIGKGSGAADMAFLVPRSVFAGLADSTNIYLYSKFGGDLASGDADAGFEEWTQAIPEPYTGSLLCIFSMGLALRRRR